MAEQAYPLTIASIHALLATRYLGAAGLVCVLYDHLLTLKDEWLYFWKPRRNYWDFVAVVFFLNRYSNEAGLLYVAYIYAGMHSGNFNGCKDITTAIMVLGVISLGTANVFMTMRHYSLWDRRRFAMLALWTAFGISYTAVFVLFIFTVKDFREAAFYSPIAQTCLLDKKPIHLVGIWVCMLSFDVFTLFLAVTNALDRPYRHRVDVLIHLRRDGAIYFIALLGLRIMNLVLSIVLNPEEIFLVVFFIWAMVTLILSRMMLRVEAIKSRTGSTGEVGIHIYEMDEWRLRDI